jgi:glycerol kinase
MEHDAGHPMNALRVDGGMVANSLLLQFQADLLQQQVRVLGGRFVGFVSRSGCAACGVCL